MTTDQRRLQLVLWGAFVVGVAIYPTALTIIVHQWRPAYDADFLARLQMLCLLGAILQAIAAAWFARRGAKLLASGPDDQRGLWHYAVAWALSEAIGLYGLLVGLWRAEPEVSTLFFTWAIALILAFRPPAARAGADAPAAEVPASS